MPDNNKAADSNPDPRAENRVGNQPEDKTVGAAESKKARWSLFGGAGKATEAEETPAAPGRVAARLVWRKQRVGRVRRQHAVYHAVDGNREVSVIAVACALSDSLPLLGKGEAPPFAARLCYRVQAPAADPLTVPPLSPLLPPKGAKLREWAEQTLLAVFTDALNTIKLMLRQTPPAAANALYVETDVCNAALRLAPRLKSPALVEATLRLLRMFPPDLARETGPFGRQTPELRSLASLYLAALSPDDLYPLWVGLNGSDANLRQTLLPVLDYLNDPRVVPYLIKMLERHSQWADGDMAAWAARSRPTAAAGSPRPAGSAPPDRHVGTRRVPFPPNPRHVRPQPRARAGRPPRHRIHRASAPAQRTLFLLRPSQPDATHLLRPAEDNAREDANHAELLRSAKWT